MRAKADISGWMNTAAINGKAKLRSSGFLDVRKT